MMKLRVFTHENHVLQEDVFHIFFLNWDVSWFLITITQNLIVDSVTNDREVISMLEMNYLRTKVFVFWVSLVQLFH